MGVKNFFKKIGKGIVKAGRFIKNKAIPFVGRLAKPILNGISMLPGKIGYIGKLGSALSGMAESIVPKIPNEDMHRKVGGRIDRERQIAHDSFKKFKNNSEALRDTINDVKNKYNNEVKPLIKPIISSNTS